MYLYKNLSVIIYDEEGFTMYDMKSDFDWFKQNREQIIKDHIGERVVIQNKEIKGYFPNENDAINFMKPTPIGEFIIQRCLPEDKDVEFYFTGRYAFQ